ncbi:unknown [Ruminococcus sp. CAG:382]|nr:unknown [Ruminococcus sp. CAG:382]
MTILTGESAVPCRLQPAIAGVICHLRAVHVQPRCSEAVERRVLRDCLPRTMSGGEPSSIKRICQCAVRSPVLRTMFSTRVCASFDYGCMVISRIPSYFRLEKEAFRCTYHCTENTVPRDLRICSVRSISEQCSSASAKPARSRMHIFSAEHAEPAKRHPRKFSPRRSIAKTRKTASLAENVPPAYRLTTAPQQT